MSFRLAGQSPKSPGSEKAGPEKGHSGPCCAAEPASRTAKTAEKLRLSAVAPSQEGVCYDLEWRRECDRVRTVAAAQPGRRSRPPNNWEKASPEARERPITSPSALTMDRS